MDKTQQTPLAERLQGTGPRSMGLPIAMACTPRILSAWSVK